MKSCTKCGEEKPLEAYPRRACRSDGRESRCLVCSAGDKRAWHAANSTPSKAYYQVPANRMRRRAWKHGLTAARYIELVEQGCGICGREFDLLDTGGHYHVDHDHACCSNARSCGACVRSVLCRWCNVILGHAKDDPVTLEAAAAYLRKHAYAGIVSREDSDG